MVDVDSLLDTEFRHKHIKGSVQDADDLGLPDDRAVALREVRDQDAKIQVRRLLLSELSRIALTVI